MTGRGGHKWAAVSRHFVGAVLIVLRNRKLILQG